MHIFQIGECEVMPQRLGILGGTFDPVHIGHLRIAEEAVEKLALEKLLFIPSADPPHKTRKDIVRFQDRWEMLKLAVESNPRFDVSDVERRMPGKSYSVQTLRRLREEALAETDFFFLLGLDAFLELHSWWHFRELFSLACLVVLPRSEYDPGLIEHFLRREISSSYSWEREGSSFLHPSLFPVYCLKGTVIGVSSTQIRRLVGEGRSIRYLVLPEVMRYIEKNGLYTALA